MTNDGNEDADNGNDGQDISPANADGNNDNNHYRHVGSGNAISNDSHEGQKR